MEFLQGLVEFIGAAFLRLNALELVLIVAIVVGLYFLSRLVTAITTNEYVKANDILLGMLANSITNAIMYAAWGQIDFSEYSDKAADYEQEHGRYIDPRMWYVLDKAEAWLETYGFEIEFDDLLSRAEALYQDLKLEGRLPLRSEDDLPVAEV